MESGSKFWKMTPLTPAAMKFSMISIRAEDSELWAAVRYSMLFSEQYLLIS